MSRVTPPVTKINHAIRRISSSARSASFIDQSRHVSIYLPRKLSELRNECSKRKLDSNGNKLELADRLAAYDLLGSSRDFHSSHRPVQETRTIPMMQGFRTSAISKAARDSSTLDHCIFPSPAEESSTNPFARLRVPLLPDNYTPDRSASSPHAVESLDEALSKPEISVIAAYPEMVLPAMMSEVVGNDGLDMDIGQLTKGFVHTPAAYIQSVKESVTETIAENTGDGGLKELWSGIVDDILGPRSSSKST